MNAEHTSQTPTTVAIANLGCKANQYDGTYLAALLQARNFKLVDFKEKADVYVINTCTVTDKANLDSRNIIRRAHRRNPESITVVTGCYAQTQPQEVAQIEGVNLIVGNGQKAHLLEHLEKARQERDKIHIQVDNIFHHREIETFGLSSHSDNARAYVKIQDGCNQFCTFCIIPFARGRNRSIPIDRVIAELRQLSAQGFQEAILTGIHLGTYGIDLEPRRSLAELLEKIETERPIHRVRISSVDPEEIDGAIIEILADSKIFCPHLHIPLQSGDDKILQLMKRRYTTKQFLKTCDRLKAKIPHLGLGTDVIVGFPYEDEASFSKTKKLLEDSPLTYLHVFPYSSKTGTKAAQMLGQIPVRIRKDRSAELRELSAQKALSFRLSQIGRRVEVILEQSLDKPAHSESPEKIDFQAAPKKLWSGTSENYLPILIQGENLKLKQITPCTLASESGGRLVGTA